jgi:hypothetical protein
MRPTCPAHLTPDDFITLKPGPHLYQISVSVSWSACENRVLYQARVSEMIHWSDRGCSTKSRSFAVTSKGRYVIQKRTVWTGAFHRSSLGKPRVLRSRRAPLTLPFAPYPVHTILPTLFSFQSTFVWGASCDIKKNWFGVVQGKSSRVDKLLKRPFCGTNCSWRDIVTTGTQLMIQDWWVWNWKIRVEDTDTWYRSGCLVIRRLYQVLIQIRWFDTSVDMA